LLLTLPVQLEQGKNLATFTDTTSGIAVKDSRIEIPVKDAQGTTQMTLVAQTAGFTGTGTTATAAVTSLTLVAKEQTVDLSKDDARVGQVAYGVEANLKELPKDAKLTITPKKTLPATALAGFELVARNENMTIKDVGAALEIVKENLENVTQVGEVTITMKVGRAWVEAQGGISRIRMSRIADDGSREWLATSYVGDDADGRMIFQAKSPKGFSLFALVAVAPLPPNFEVSQLFVNPAAASPGDAVTVSAVVSNKGGSIGTYNVILAINGTGEDSEAVTLDAGKSTTVTFLVVKDAEGTYSVQIEKLTGSFQVATRLAANEISFSSLQISPPQAGLDQPVTISVKVTNTSARAGMTDVTLKVNKVAVETKSVRLAAGASEVVTFTVKRATAASYSFEVGGQTGTFSVVQPLTPAAFSLSDLKITPASVKVNEAATITVRVANTGETSGTYTVQLKLNGNVVESQDVTVEGLSSQLVTFSVTQATSGTYQVAIGNQSATLNVAAEKAAFPIGIIIGIVAAVVVVIGAVLVYFLVIRRRKPVSA
jgi:hypothetical protein